MLSKLEPVFWISIAILLRIKLAGRETDKTTVKSLVKLVSPVLETLTLPRILQTWEKGENSILTKDDVVIIGNCYQVCCPFKFC